MNEPQLPDIKSLIKFTQLYPDSFDDLLTMKEQWEENNNQYSSLTAFLRHQYTNYDELCSYSYEYIPMSENPDDEEIDRFSTLLDEFYYTLKFWASEIVREELNRKYNLGIDNIPPQDLI